MSVKSKYITILWSTLSVFTINCEKFKPDHIVPLVFIDDNAKSINESRKRKSSEPKLNPPKQSKISFPRSSKSGPLKIESTLVIPATPSLLDSGEYTQCNTSNTLDTEVNSQIKSQNVTIPTRKSLQLKVPIEKAHKYDICLYISKIESISEEDVYGLIKNVWVPPGDYEFPYTKSCKFSQDWQWLFPYLFYSEYLDGAFCLPCVLFGRHSYQTSTLKNVYTAPLKAWKRARSRLESHFGSPTATCKCKLHKDSVCLFTGFVKTKSDMQTDVYVRIDTQKTEEARNNRKAIKAIADTVIFLGREGLPFHGHEDDTNTMQKLENSQSTASVYL